METTARHTGRKILTTLAIFLISAIAGYFLIYHLSSRPQELSWSAENLSGWIDEQVQAEQTTAQCLLTGGADVEAEVRQYFEDTRWQEDNPEYYVQTADTIRDYQLSDVTYALSEDSGGVLLDAAFTYDAYSFSTKDAPRLESDAAVVVYLAGHINTDGTPVVFSYNSDTLSDSDLESCISQALSNNTAYGTDDVACDYSSFPDSETADAYLYLTSSYAFAEPSADYTRQAMTALDDLEVQVRALSPATDEDIYRTIAQVVCDSMEYDDALADITTAKMDDPDAFTPEELARRGLYGAAVLHKTVCSGYAVTYQALCQRLGVDCWEILGTNEGEEHVWNMISLNGQRWFIDCTFMDTGDWHEDLFTEDEYAERGYEAAADTIYPW